MAEPDAFCNCVVSPHKDVLSVCHHPSVSTSCWDRQAGHAHAVSRKHPSRCARIHVTFIIKKSAFEVSNSEEIFIFCGLCSRTVTTWPFLTQEKLTQRSNMSLDLVSKSLPLVVVFSQCLHMAATTEPVGGTNVRFL